MAATVKVLMGPAGSGKTTLLLGRYRKRLSDREFGSTLWLAPTYRSAADIRQRLLDSSLTHCFAPGVMTFERFADAVVGAADRVTHRLGGLLKRQLIRRVIETARSQQLLEHFEPIAQTRGLVDLLAELVSEFKRLEIWPEDLERASGGARIRAKDREILWLYSEYQRLLTEHDLYDAEGRFWSARALLREGQRRPFECLRTVVVDGFTDFTRTQHEILAILAQWGEEIEISLPGESGKRRQNLFAKSHATLDLLRGYHPHLAVDFVQAEMDWPAANVLSRELFGDPRERPQADGRGIEVIAASGSRGEWLQIGRRVKQLLIEGDGSRHVRPGDVAVVVRSAGEAAGLAGEVFRELGLPHAIESGPRLSDNQAVRALLALWRLDQEDWPFRSLLSVVASSYFRPCWPEFESGRATRAAEWVIRNLQVPSSRSRLLELIEVRRKPDVARLEQADQAERARLEQEAFTYDQAAGLLNRLAGLLDSLPHRATPVEWAEALRHLAVETGLAHVAATPREEPDSLSDAEAIDQLLHSVAAGNGLAARLGEEPRAMGRSELAELLLDGVRWEQVASAIDETGRVRILSAASVRALSVPYLFVAGLSERSFPSSLREDRLYSEAEYQRLHKAGLPVVLRSERSAEEMLLFYEVVTRATRRLTLSYPAWDDKAESLLPSPYLAEMNRIFGDGLQKVVDHTLSPVPEGQWLCSMPQWRIRAMHEALAGSTRLLGQLLTEPGQKPWSDNLTAALETTRLRRSRQEWSVFEGMVGSEAARNWLAHRFGSTYTWTVSHLEQYASCPYQFFLQRLVGLSPLGQLSLEEDRGHRGWMIHEALARLHRQAREILKLNRSFDAAELAERFLSTIDELLAELPGEGLVGAQDDRDIWLHRVAVWRAVREISGQRAHAGNGRAKSL